MPTVRYEVSTGAPSEVQEELRRAVAGYARGASGYMIGRTSNPASRSSAPEYVDYDEMIVVYQTDSIGNADTVEEELIEFFDDSDNFRGGGGGPVGDAPYYVYVVVEK